MIVQSLSVVVQAVLIVAACRWIASTSRTLSVLVWIGILLRLVSGLGLFALSYFDLEIAHGLHDHAGFWTLAPDARVYHDLASRAAAEGLTSVRSGSPSPFFVAVLGGWFSALGAHPISSILFNLACYVVTCLAIVATVRSQADAPGVDRQRLITAAAVIIASFTFSPLLILSSTQALKDPFFVMLIVLGCVGALTTLIWMTRSTLTDPVPLLVGLLIVLVALAGIAGTRAYFGVFLWAAYASALVAALIVVHGRRRWNVLLLGIAVLGLMWMSFRVGAGSYYDVYRGLVINSVRGSAAFLNVPGIGDDGAASLSPGARIITFRRGFVRSAGGTNLADETMSGTALVEITRDTAIGAAAMLLPITLLEALSIVDLRGGGRGLLMVTDFDTLFLDLTLIASFFLVFRNRFLLLRNPSAAVFMLMLALITGLLAAYIVTNFGTLFRLRMLSIVPVWLLPLAAGSTGPRETMSEHDNRGGLSPKRRLSMRLII